MCNYLVARYSFVFHDGLLMALKVAALSHLTAHSAASSLALFRLLPSYQNLASRVLPLTVTLLDQAVRPPSEHRAVSKRVGDRKRVEATTPSNLSQPKKKKKVNSSVTKIEILDRAAREH